ncbi:MAG: hypothetical protein AAFS10_22425, partial [Myxococcota bacterium]
TACGTGSIDGYPSQDSGMTSDRADASAEMGSEQDTAQETTLTEDTGSPTDTLSEDGALGDTSTPTPDTELPERDTAPSDTEGAALDTDEGPMDTATDTDGDPMMDTADPGDDDTFRPTPEGVPIWVAQGHVGRTIISCDDGRTWVGDRSFDQEGHALVCGQPTSVVCYADNSGCQFMHGDACQTTETRCDCDHHPGAGRGVTWGDGWFVATFGWGPAGGLFRSQDGITWSQVASGTTFAGVAYGNGTFVTGGRQPLISDDGGATWSQGGQADLQSPAGETIWNARQLAFVDLAAGGRFVMVGQDQSRRDLLVSANNGATWERPNPLPDRCADQATGITGNAERIVVVSQQGHTCVSTDAGRSFALYDMGEGPTPESRPLYDGRRFIAWSRGQVHTSPDGITWTVASTTPANLQIGGGSVDYNPDTGTYTAVRAGWQNWYGQQEFYRSTDGVVWERLASEQVTTGHSIHHITRGIAPPGTICPTP